MCTSTVELAEALRLQLEIVIVLVTGEPASGIATSVPFVPEQPGGGGGLPPPTKSRAFGEPVPGFFTTFLVALLTSVSRTCAGVKDGFAESTRAEAPVTCGVAIEVPLIVFVAVSLVSHDDVMFTPGAKMSTHVPKLEKEARLSLMSVAPTVMAPGTRAGEKLHALALLLPAAMA